MVRPGWIKIHRGMLDWEWYSDEKTFKVFMHLLLTANHKDSEWRGIAVKRGQRIISYNGLAKETDISVRSVRTCVERLIKTKELTCEPTHNYTIITIENYNKYQGDDDESDTQTDMPPTYDRHSTDTVPTCHRHQIKNDKNNKNDKNEENDKKLYKDAPEELHPTIESFIEMRKKIKAPMTDDAIRLMLKKVNKMAGGDVAKSRAIMEQSIMNSWKGVFPLRDSAGGEKGPRNEVLEMLEAGEFSD